MAEAINRLAIVGASVRAAAFSALRAGYEVVAADLFADADLRRVCAATRVGDYPEGFVDWLARTECDAWLYTGALENYPVVIDRMAAVRPLLGCDAAAVRGVRHPLRLQQALEDAGLHFPETVASSAGLPLDGSWLCKTYRGASGSGVWLLDSSKALERAERAGAVYQRRLVGHDGDAAAIFALGASQGTLLGLTQQFVGPPWAPRPWQYGASMGPTTVGTALEEQLRRLPEVLRREFNLRGLVGVDLVLQGESAWIVEVNPRYSASVEVVERMTCESAMALHVAACGGSALPRGTGSPASFAASEGARRAYGKAIVFAQRDVRISEGFHHWALERSALDWTECSIADVPQASELIEEGRPALTIFADGPGSSCQAQLEQLKAEVESRLYAE